jgi:plastocyanin
VPVGLLVVIALMVTACSSSSGSTSVGLSKTGTTITIQNFAFNPAALAVHPGQQIVVANKDGVTHTLTSDSGAFNTGNIASGQTVHFQAPAKAGTYHYRCNIHQFMTGTLIVS